MSDAVTCTSYCLQNHSLGLQMLVPPPQRKCVYWASKSDRWWVTNLEIQLKSFKNPKNMLDHMHAVFIFDLFLFFLDGWIKSNSSVTTEVTFVWPRIVFLPYAINDTACTPTTKLKHLNMWDSENIFIVTCIFYYLSLKLILFYVSLSSLLTHLPGKLALWRRKWGKSLSLRKETTTQTHNLGELSCVSVFYSFLGFTVCAPIVHFFFNMV